MSQSTLRDTDGTFKTDWQVEAIEAPEPNGSEVRRRFERVPRDQFNPVRKLRDEDLVQQLNDSLCRIRTEVCDRCLTNIAQHMVPVNVRIQEKGFALVCCTCLHPTLSVFGGEA